MARERTTPSPSTYVQDFGLNVTPAPVNRNKRVVILGTAEDGPMYEPIQINKPEEAEFVWGRRGAGDLVRGIFECWDVQTGYPTVVGVRIGNGTKAKLEIEEAVGAGVDDEQGSNFTSLTLEALYPGAIYNGSNISYNDNREVSIYNPKTGLASTFSIDTENPNNSNVDAHNVAELVDAINADTNINSIMVASYSGILTDFEVAVSGVSAGINSVPTYVTVNLPKVLGAGLVTTNGYMVPSPINSGLTSSNNIVEVEAVEAVSISEWEKLECASQATNKLAVMPLDGKVPAAWQTIQALKDYDADNVYYTDPSGDVVSEFTYAVDNALIDVGAGAGSASISGGYESTNTFILNTPFPLDDSEETSNSGVASGIIVTNYNSYYGGYATGSGTTWRNATASGIATKLVNAVATRPSGLIVVQASTSSDPAAEWQTLPYNVTSGVYLQSWDGTLGTSGTATFGVGPTTSGNAAMGILVDGATETIKENVYLRVSAVTTKGTLIEKENLNNLSATTSTSQYFIRGQEVVFNTAPAFDMYINYGTRISYEVGSTVELTDPTNGIFTFSTPDLLPGPAGAELSDSVISYLRFRYRYLPTFPNITTIPKVLANGKDGNNLDGRQRKEELVSAYDLLRNYGSDLWVPMGAFIDELTERYNPVTGLKETVVVNYNEDLEDFLEDLSINNIQPHAVLGVVPMETVTQANKDLWHKRLTVRDISDPNRAANVMANIQDKFMSVVAFEPVFLNTGRGRPYVGNGQAAYAGLLASIPYDISPINKGIPGVQNLRYSFSASQYEALNDARYVAMKTRTGRVPVIIEDKTAAPVGSDFVNWSTFSITAEASNRVYLIADSYIGKQNSVPVRSSLEQEISNALMSMSGLRGFDFTITSSPTQQVIGVVEIDLILVPIFAIKKIRTTVKLRKSLPVL